MLKTVRKTSPCDQSTASEILLYRFSEKKSKKNAITDHIFKECPRNIFWHNKTRKVTANPIAKRCRKIRYESIIQGAVRNVLQRKLQFLRDDFMFLRKIFHGIYLQSDCFCINLTTILKYANLYRNAESCDRKENCHINSISNIRFCTKTT